MRHHKTRTPQKPGALRWTLAAAFALAALTFALGTAGHTTPPPPAPVMGVWPASVTPTAYVADSGDQSDRAAYDSCMAYYANATHCRVDVYGLYDSGIVSGQVSEQAWQALMQQGWTGDPFDGRDALYRPPFEDESGWDCATMGNQVCGPLSPVGTAVGEVA